MELRGKKIFKEKLKVGTEKGKMREKKEEEQLQQD